MAEVTLDDVLKKLDERLTAMEGRVNNRFDAIESRLKGVDDRFNRLERNVNAISSFPIPSRPRTYHSATEFASVSRPQRRRLGHMG